MHVKRVIQYLLVLQLEPLLEPLSALEPLAGTLLEPPFQRRNPFQRTLPALEPLPAPFWHPPADPSSARTPS